MQTARVVFATPGTLAHGVPLAGAFASGSPDAEDAVARGAPSYHPVNAPVRPRGYAGAPTRQRAHQALSLATPVGPHTTNSGIMTVTGTMCVGMGPEARTGVSVAISAHSVARSCLSFCLARRSPLPRSCLHFASAVSFSNSPKQKCMCPPGGRLVNSFLGFYCTFA